MPEPEPKLPASAPPITRFQAQVHLGLFAAHDIVTLSLLVLTWVVIGFYWLFRPEPSFTWVLFGMLVSLVLLGLWLVILAYRILVRLLDIQADINLMPEAAARLAVGYFEGRKPPAPPKR